MTSKKCENNSSKGGFVEVPIDPEFPIGWKKKVYEMNGRLVPRWTIWFDTQGNKFVNEKKVRAKLTEMKEKENTIVTTEIPVQIEAQHVPEETSIKRPEFKCEDLKIVYNARNAPDPGTSYTCNICSLDFSSEAEFSLHNNLHRSMVKTNNLNTKTLDSPNQKSFDTFQCFDCGNISTNKLDHGKHQVTHSKLQPFSCPICYQRFSQRANVMRHRRNKHPGQEFTKEMLESIQTPVKLVETFQGKNNFDHIKTEVKNIHSNSFVNIRQTEPIGFKQEPSCKVLSSHLNQMYKEPGKPSSMKIEESNSSENKVCDVCAKLYSSKKNMMRHRRKDHPEIPIPQYSVQKQYSEEQSKAYFESMNMKPPVKEEPVHLDSIKPVQFESMKPLHLDSMKPVQLDSMRPVQLDSMRPEQLDSMKQVQVDSIKPVQFDRMKSVQVNSMKPVKLDSMRPVGGAVHYQGMNSVAKQGQRNYKIKPREIEVAVNPYMVEQFARKENTYAPTIQNPMVYCDVCAKGFLGIHPKKYMQKHRRTYHPDAPIINTPMILSNPLPNKTKSSLSQEFIAIGKQCMGVSKPAANGFTPKPVVHAITPDVNMSDTESEDLDESDLDQEEGMKSNPATNFTKDLSDKMGVHVESVKDEKSFREGSNENSAIVYCDVCSKGFTGTYAKKSTQRHRRRMHQDVPMPKIKEVVDMRSLFVQKRDALFETKSFKESEYQPRDQIIGLPIGLPYPVSTFVEPKKQDAGGANSVKSFKDEPNEQTDFPASAGVMRGTKEQMAYPPVSFVMEPKKPNSASAYPVLSFKDGPNKEIPYSLSSGTEGVNEQIADFVSSKKKPKEEISSKEETKEQIVAFSVSSFNEEPNIHTPIRKRLSNPDIANSETDSADDDFDESDSNSEEENINTLNLQQINLQENSYSNVVDPSSAVAELLATDDAHPGLGVNAKSLDILNIYQNSAMDKVNEDLKPKFEDFTKTLSSKLGEASEDIQEQESSDSEYDSESESDSERIDEKVNAHQNFSGVTKESSQKGRNCELKLYETQRIPENELTLTVMNEINKEHLLHADGKTMSYSNKREIEESDSFGTKKAKFVYEEDNAVNYSRNISATGYLKKQEKENSELVLKIDVDSQGKRQNEESLYQINNTIVGKYGLKQKIVLKNVYDDEKENPAKPTDDQSQSNLTYQQDIDQGRTKYKNNELSDSYYGSVDEDEELDESVQVEEIDLIDGFVGADLNEPDSETDRNNETNKAYQNSVKEKELGQNIEKNNDVVFTCDVESEGEKEGENEQENEKETGEKNQGENEKDNLNNSLDIVTEYYNKIIQDNSKLLSIENITVEEEDCLDPGLDEEYDSDNIDETDTVPHKEVSDASLDHDESNEEISQVTNSTNTSLDIATQFYNNIILGNTKQVKTGALQPEVNNVETILSRYKNVLGDKSAQEEPEIGLEIEDEIMLSPVRRANLELTEENINAELQPNENTTSQILASVVTDNKDKPEFDPIKKTNSIEPEPNQDTVTKYEHDTFPEVIEDIVPEMIEDVFPKMVEDTVPEKVEDTVSEMVADPVTEMVEDTVAKMDVNTFPEETIIEKKSYELETKKDTFDEFDPSMFTEKKDVKFCLNQTVHETEVINVRKHEPVTEAIDQKKLEMSQDLELKEQKHTPSQEDKTQTVPIESSTEVENRKLQCKLCPKNFVKKKKLVKHLIEHKLNLIAKPGTTEQPKEDDVANLNKMPKEISSNPQKTSSSTPQVIDSITQEINSTPHPLQQEMNMQENKPEPSINNIKNLDQTNSLSNFDIKSEQFNCMECDKIFLSKYKLTRHSSCHTKERAFVCHICQKGFTQKSNRDTHLRKVHKLNILSDSSLTDDQNMASDNQDPMQVSSHLNAPSPVLTPVNATGPMLTQLNIPDPVLTQLNIPDPVYHLNAQDPIQTLLNTPEIVNRKRKSEHVGEAKNPKSVKRPRSSKESSPKECRSCQKSFTSTQSLKNHTEYVHEGVRHTCDSCEYQAGAAASLKMHKQAVHVGITFSCEFCSHIAKFKSSLIAHLKRKHPSVY